MNDTLVLDAGYQLVGLTNWKRAILLWEKDKAEVLTEDQIKSLRSEYFEMGMPLVIRLKHYVMKHSHKRVAFNRANFWMRDNGMCQYCGVKLNTREMTLDHVLPRALGGVSSWENLVVACVPCNNRKDNKTLSQSGMTLRQKPAVPDPRDPRYVFRHALKLRNEWKPYLEMNGKDTSYTYWTAELER